MKNTRRDVHPVGTPWWRHPRTIVACTGCGTRFERTTAGRTIQYYVYWYPTWYEGLLPSVTCPGCRQQLDIGTLREVEDV